MEGFLLGLSTGAVCISTCVPALMPFLLMEERRTGRNFCYLGEFLLGRLLGYMLFAFAAWMVSCCLIDAADYRGTVHGVVFYILAVWLLIYTLAKTERNCPANTAGGRLALSARAKGWIAPLMVGFLTGLNLCPPFLLAFAGASDRVGFLNIALYFLLFFLGTSVYFLPLPFTGVLKMRAQLQVIGKMAALIASAYYLYTGTLYIIGGFQ
jgi:sulfite exporter TauE/SafE